MRKNDYKKTLDKIKCSEAFSEKMREKLSASIERTHEFSDTVSGTEAAKPRLWKNITAGAAACLVLAGSCVGLFKLIEKSDIEQPMIDNPSSESDTTAITTSSDKLSYYIDIAAKYYENGGSVHYVEGGGQFESGYEFTPDSKEIISILVKLKSISWKMTSLEEWQIMNDTDRIFKGGYALRSDNDIASLQFDGTGQLVVYADKPYYFVPRTKADKTNLYKILTELEELRIENVNELLPFMLSEYSTNGFFSADVESYNKFSFPTAFEGDQITNYTDVEYTLNGKIYSETFNIFYYSLMNGKAKMSNDESFCDVTIEHAFDLNDNFKNIIREEYIDPNDIFHQINMYRNSNYSRKKNISTIFTEYHPSYYPNLSDDYTDLPGDYFGLYTSILNSISQIDPTWTEEDSDFDLREYCHVTVENNPETGGKDMIFCIDSLPIYYNVNSAWNIIFTITDDHIMTKYEKYEDMNLISKYELSNISYDNFDPVDFSSEMNDYISSNTSDAGSTDE